MENQKAHLTWEKGYLTKQTKKFHLTGKESSKEMLEIVVNEVNQVPKEYRADAFFPGISTWKNIELQWKENGEDKHFTLKFQSDEWKQYPEMYRKEDAASENALSVLQQFQAGYEASKNADAGSLRVYGAEKWKYSVINYYVPATETSTDWN